MRGGRGRGGGVCACVSVAEQAKEPEGGRILGGLIEG
jgi:hypothetical protein